MRLVVARSSPETRRRTAARRRRSPRSVARAFLLLAALLAVVAVWRLASELGVEFGPPIEGYWARWQPWFAGAGVVAAVGWTLAGGADSAPFRREL